MMKMPAALCGLLLLTSSAWAEQPAKSFYNSQTDFVEMSLALKAPGEPNPGYIGLSVVLSPEASARTAALSAQAMNQPLTIYLNGRPLSTATVRGVIDTGQLRLQIPKESLVEMMPSLMR